MFDKPDKPIILNKIRKRKHSSKAIFFCIKIGIVLCYDTDYSIAKYSTPFLYPSNAFFMTAIHENSIPEMAFSHT